jgi:hypothetical protein
VAALANAINTIDGFNGLASMVASLAYGAFQVSDPIVLSASFIMMDAALGFFIWNFPAGLIFLGDGGAYFIGFMLAELSIMLVMKHRALQVAEVSWRRCPNYFFTWSIAGYRTENGDNREHYLSECSHVGPWGKAKPASQAFLDDIGKPDRVALSGDFMLRENARTSARSLTAWCSTASAVAAAGRALLQRLQIRANQTNVGQLQAVIQPAA